jgi:hypothetical protein
MGGMGLFRGGAVRGGDIDTVDATSRSGEGLVTAVASTLALVFSAYSLYETAVRRPDLRAFVPPVIRYADPYNGGNFEVFEVPVTVVNLGAQSGTVLSMDLEVENSHNKTVKKFYSSDFGRWTMDNARALSFRPYAPISLPGKSSSSDSVLFYARDDQKVERIAEQKGGNYKFKLTLNAAFPEDLGIFDRFWLNKPEPVSFEMEMPELDHRVFDVGTVQLHAPHWKVAGVPGAAASGSPAAANDVTSSTTAEKTPDAPDAAAEKAANDNTDAAEAALHESLVEKLKADCKTAKSGSTLTSVSSDFKTGVSASAEYTCP